MKSSKQYPEAVREQAVRMVLEHQQDYPSEWAAICSIAKKIGCTPESLRLWVKRYEGGNHPPVISFDERQKLKELEREVRELRRSNDILRKASAYFAQAELDLRSKN